MFGDFSGSFKSFYFCLNLTVVRQSILYMTLVPKAWIIVCYVTFYEHLKRMCTLQFET